jgi:membrane protease YdiL (CAAX protease family)
MSEGATAERLPIAPAQARSRAAATTVVAYTGALVAAEALAAFGSPVTAAAVQGAMLLILLGHYVAGGERALAALALVPLLRLSSLALASDDPVRFHIVAGLPVLLAVGLAARALELDGILRLWEIRRRSQWHVALGALAVAGVLDLALHVGPLVPAAPLPRLLAAAAVVFVFAGVLEELLFRGLVQATMAPLLGPWAILVADCLFTATYLGAASGGYAATMAVFGLGCGWWARRTGSLAGAAIGHGLFAVGLLVLWPAVH